ncbi:glycosyltransferase [Actinomycetospora sp. TBRC 11914]|uniref:glycosyltransferase n=1 Tax=Actinomycetospora sp. TBRC 11914 TaxID=2729387 RepID=UPI00145E8782|nr:glycosyltransferase [Actinomycetospora sp. TBRC 11914]NMO90437.1 glycosyltransferase [Actinomycetospora sp. TBRC 11914]
MEAAGHRLRYVRLLLAAVPPARRVLLVPRSVRGSAEFAEHLADVEADVVELPESRRPAMALALATAAARGARLVVPDGDKNVAPLLLALARSGFRRAPVSLLLMRTALPGGPEPATAGMALKPALAGVLARVPGARVRFLTDAFGVVVRRRGFPGIEPVRDPVEPPAAALEREGNPRAGRATGSSPRESGEPFRVGVFGVVSARKNVPVLLAALAGARDDDAAAGAHLVVGGRCEPDVREFLGSSPDAAVLTAAGRLHVDDRLLTEDEFDTAVAGVDAVAVLHDNDAPSGVVAEAAARGVPVLGPARGWASSMVTGTGIGEVAEVDDPDDVRAALGRLVDAHPRRAAAARRARTRLGTNHFVRGLLGNVT